jgi:hypothetical protein
MDDTTTDRDPRKAAAELLGSAGFTREQKREAWDAWKENPGGAELAARKAEAIGKREGRPWAGLFLSMIRSGDHLHEPEPATPLVTGWRWVRGDSGAAGTYIRDPKGTDQLPPGYDFLTRNPVVVAHERSVH